MIQLVPFLEHCGVAINRDNYKVHLATQDKEHPLEVFFQGRFKEWQEEQTRRNFSREHVLALIDLRKQKDRWLFAGVYRILGCEKRVGM